MRHYRKYTTRKPRLERCLLKVASDYEQANNALQVEIKCLTYLLKNPIKPETWAALNTVTER